MRDLGVVDANVFLRTILLDIADQAVNAKALLDEFESGESRGYVPITVIQEIVFVLERQYRVGRQSVAESLRALCDIANLDVEHRRQVLSCLDDYLERLGISFSDAYHCAVARDFHNGAIVSFDRKISGVPGINRIEP